METEVNVHFEIESFRWKRMSKCGNLLLLLLLLTCSAHQATVEKITET
jgi:hypothetical protein